MNKEEKEEKKVEKTSIFIIIIAILTLLVAIIGATFAYFAANIVGNDEASSVLIRTSSLTIEYKTQNEINVTNVGPGFSKDLNFTISNKSGVSAGYNLYWVIGTNEFVNNDLVYTLTASSDKTGDTFVTADKVVIPKSTEMIGTGIIPDGAVQSYKLTVEFLNRNANQDADQNKSFAGKIEVRGKQ